MIGDILDKLEELNIADNTLLIYTADHGSDMKASLFNTNGTQVPFLMRWPASIPAGIESDALVQNIDMAPTYFDIVNATPPEGYQIDGISLLPLLKTGETPEGWREHLYFELGNARAVMTDDGWKYIAIRYPQELIDRIKEMEYHRIPRSMAPLGRVGIGIRGASHPGFWDEDQLYDLHNDPWEMNNLAYEAEYADKLQRMKELMSNYLHQIGRPFGEFIPTGNAGMPGQLEKEIMVMKNTQFIGSDIILPDFNRRKIDISASSSPETAPNTLDGSLSTHWQNSGLGAWIQYEFCQEERLYGVNIAFRRGHLRKAYFDVEVSSDGTIWNKVITGGESSGTRLDLEPFTFPQVTARYLRIIGNGNSDNSQNHYTHIDFMIAEATAGSMMIQAEDFYQSQGMRIINVDDCVGLLGIRDINDAASVNYRLQQTPAGVYNLEIRVKPLQTGIIEIRVNDQPSSTIPIQEEMVNGGWITLGTTIELSSGINILSLQLPDGGPQNTIEMNWLKLLLSTGISQPSHENLQSFTLFPNPARDKIHISATDKIKKVIVLDVAGRLVFERSINDVNLDVSVSDLNRGMYIVRVYFEDRLEFTKFIRF
jgi:hypothetical protein